MSSGRAIAFTRRDRGDALRRRFRDTIAAGMLLLVLGVGTWWRVGRERRAADTELPVLAVLPFRNLGQVDDAYFADGVTDEVTSQLASIPGLGVTSRTSANQYRNSAKPLKQIARELGVQYVLEGSVRWDRSSGHPGRVRITPQLIDVSEDRQLWADRIDAEVTDVFQVQAAIADRVAAALGVAISSRGRDTSDAPPTTSFDAYTAYLRGEAHRAKGDPASMRRAVAEYERAIALDPSFVLPYARLAPFHAPPSWDQQDTALKASPRAAERAARLTRGLVEGHEALGLHYRETGDFERARAALQAGLSRRPRDAELVAALAYLDLVQGRWESGLRGFERASQLDPRSYAVASRTAWAHMMVRRYDAAARYADRAVAVAPDNAEAYVLRAQVEFLRTGHSPSTRRLVDDVVARFGFRAFWQVRQINRMLVAMLDSGQLATMLRQPMHAFLRDSSPTPTWRDSLSHFARKTDVVLWIGDSVRARAYSDSARPLYLRFFVRLGRDTTRFEGSRTGGGYALRIYNYLRLGRRVEARRVLDSLEALTRTATDQEDRPLWLWALAWYYTELGEHERAIDHLADLLSRPGLMSSASLRDDPIFAPLRRHPRFQRLIADSTRS